MDKRPIKRPGGKRPDRVLGRVVVEFDGVKVEPYAPIEEDDGQQSFDRTENLAAEPPNRPEADEDRQLAEQEEYRDIRAEDLMDEADQPPHQGRMLPVADLPFLPVGDTLENVHGRIGAKQARQQRPKRHMEQTEGEKDAPRICIEIVDEPGRIVPRLTR
jgi:hypothetical protein